MGVLCEAEQGKKTMIRVREYDVGRDIRAVEELERLCQVGVSGDQNPDDDDGARKKKAKKGMSLYVEQIGDPFSRIRHAPDHVILVLILTCFKSTACIQQAAAIDASILIS